MKSAVSLFLVFVLLFTATVFSPAFCEEPERSNTDDLTWEFDANTGTLSIHGTGPMRSYMDELPEWETLKDQILTVCLDDGITSVGECAFYDYGSLQTALLPDSIEVIDQFAFYYCQELRSITIPAHLRYAGRMSFYNTLLHEPEDLIFPEGMEYIGEEAFHSALKTDGKYVIPSTVTFIGPGAFGNAMFSDITVSEANTAYKSQNCALMTKDGTELILYASCAEASSYSVPDGVKKIDEECFNVVQNLVKLTIPASVTEIEEAAIFSTFQLNEIVVASDNPMYKSVDGVLYTIDGKTCLAFPDGIETSEIIIPDGVERIGSYVFYGRFGENLSVTLPESIKVIGESSMPSGIATVRIPKGIETIEPYAFCFAVGEVLYGGTEADWQAVAIGEGNSGLDNAVFRYGE